MSFPEGGMGNRSAGGRAKPKANRMSNESFVDTASGPICERLLVCSLCQFRNNTCARLQKHIETMYHGSGFFGSVIVC